MIRKASKDDIEDLCVLHRSVFDSSYFSVLYPDNLLRKYFESLFKLNDYRYVAYDENGRILGYLIGGYRSQEAVDIFLRDNFSEVLLCTLKHPSLIIRAIEKVIRKVKPVRFTSKAKMRLFLIGVDLSINKKGIGSTLLERFEEDLRTHGINMYGLYVRKNNLNAINFYYKKGFSPEFTVSNLMCLIKYL